MELLLEQNFPKWLLVQFVKEQELKVPKILNLVLLVELKDLLLSTRWISMVKSLFPSQNVKFVKVKEKQ